jgi:hypothetical protein
MKFYFLQIVVAVVAILVASTPVHAEWVDTFEGGFDQAWISGNITASPPASSGTFTFTSVSNILQVQDPTAAASGGAASGFGVVNETFGKVLVGAVTNPAGDGNMNQYLGVLARMNLATLSGYAFTVDYLSGTGSIDLSRITNASVTNLATGSLSSFSSTDSLYIQLRGRGDKLVGSVYDQIGGSLLGKIEADDSTYASGWAGVVVNVSATGSPTTPLRGTFDMVSASIPEPGSVVMLISGCLCAVGLVWRRRQRQS